MNLTADLQSLVLDEPAYLLRPDDAMRHGSRLRRRRQLASGGLAVAGVAAGVALALMASSGPGAGPARDSVVPGGPAQAQAEPQGAIERAVRAGTPAAWTFSHVDAPDAASFQADVDDGAGAGRLAVGTSPSPGSMQQHPCSDGEFALKARCTETEVSGLGRLVVRELARSGPVTMLTVVIVQPDGSGVYVEADNAVWPDVDLAPGTRVTLDQKRALSTPTVTRTAPVYSIDQLVEIAKAVDATR